MISGAVNKETNEISTINAAHVAPGSSSAPAVKPPYTYTELIEQALSERGPLTVAEIYRWIS